MSVSGLAYTLEEIADTCSRIANEAGNQVMSFFSNEIIKPSIKGDMSPLSQADLISHNYITYQLKKIFPNIPIVSEENDVFSIQASDMFWLVDPLDGTRDFIDGKPTFTVNIALICNNSPIIGVIYAPALNACYKATKSGKAYKKTVGYWQEIQTKRPIHKPVIVCSRDHGYSLSEEWAQENLSSYTILKLGSSLKFCLIAEGNAHFYPRFQPTRQWDTAAGEVILKASGGNLVTFSGEPLYYDGLSSPNPNFIAYWNFSGFDKIENL